MNDAAQTTKNLAQKIAKQMANEPFEILKEAKTQVGGGEELNINSEDSQTGGEENPQKNEENTKALAERDKIRSQRLIEALQHELRDTTKSDLIKNLQSKIASGETVYLENYPQLSPEEKEMLKKQIEAVNLQKQQATSKEQGLVEPVPHKGRKLFNFGKKTQMQRQQTQTERPLPPSG